MIHYHRSFIIIGIFLLSLFFPTPSKAQDDTEAGRKLHLHEQLTDEMMSYLINIQNLQENSKHVGLILFTRENQEYSIQMRQELAKVLEKDELNILTVWEFTIIEEENEKVDQAQKISDANWTKVIEDSKAIFSLFGIKVFPTLFVINPSFSIEEYHAGFSMTTINAIHALIHDKKMANGSQEGIHNSPEEKKHNRHERFAFKLYELGNYDASLQQLDNLSALSPRAELLRVFVQIQLMQYAEAEKSLNVLKAELYTEDELLYAEALIMYFNKNYASALEKIQKMEISDDDYQTIYLESLLFGKMDNSSESKKKYKAAKKIIGREPLIEELLIFEN